MDKASLPPPDYAYYEYMIWMKPSPLPSSYASYEYTVGKNIIASTKIQNNNILTLYNMVSTYGIKK